MTQRQQILQMLRDAYPGEVTTADFLRANLPRFSARLLELRGEGHRIVGRRLGASSWAYRWVSGETVGARELKAKREGRPLINGQVSESRLAGPRPESLFDLPPEPESAISAITGKKL